MRLKLSADELAEKGQVSRTTQYGYENGSAAPDARYLAAVEQVGVDVMWVITGRHLDEVNGSASAGAGVVICERSADGWASLTQQPRTDQNPRTKGGKVTRQGALLPVTQEAAKPLVLEVHVQGASKKLGYEVIPKVIGGAAAGRPLDGGFEPLELDRAGEMAFSYDWLARNLRHTTGELASVQVMGDSMSPTLLDGDTIIIDRGVREVQVDDIYVIHMFGRRLVKRLQRKVDGTLLIISDNPAYERETVSRAQVAEIEVIGRKVWPRTR